MTLHAGAGGLRAAHEVAFAVSRRTKGKRGEDRASLKWPIHWTDPVVYEAKR
ncbi:hypothetical protein [Paraburkholderia fungorum]|uniref:hypothetical protein n=1 Tax=Paraburkholderia fungorum TaxID=134537 RepID=UPI00181C1693|nr:hypothetical protein [Paraburkholderia fungorum]MBB5545221.1 hypothetical protein [Paraburkholderia fungorum]